MEVIPKRYTSKPNASSCIYSKIIFLIRNIRVFINNIHSEMNETHQIKFVKCLLKANPDCISSLIFYEISRILLLIILGLVTAISVQLK